MQPDLPPGAVEYLDRLEGQSCREVLGSKLWWMTLASGFFGHFGIRWPRRKVLDAQLALRKAELSENLRIHVARRRLGGDR
jgi:hypothetical protein